jgi:hypothetical protein
MVPIGRFELPASPLPRGCSTPEPYGRKIGAGDGDRTHTIGLEGRSSTIELHPQTSGFFLRCLNMVEGEGFEPSKAEPADLQSAPFGHSGTPPKPYSNKNGAPGRIRTSDRLVRSQVLYPAELRAHTSRSTHKDDQGPRVYRCHPLVSTRKG